ncbi:hypothetical protein AMJ47_00410 [Parcubacteria bacterium DG_72]|nr:MAG: hypothetical protein AMJ47_00410 [Parcubacteria bacterium DG_72]
MKTVFFGPFLGEFGWEISYWQGWVRKMCKEKYGSWRKIVASYAGRAPFYPDADEFWPHPKEITDLNISQRNYIADFWKNVGPAFEKLLKKYRESLPQDTIFYVPFKMNVYNLNNKNYLFGVFAADSFLSKVFSIPFEHQIFEELNPTQAGLGFLRQKLNPEKRIIAVFPRCRTIRRPDKNWQKGKYDHLIKVLQEKYPNHIVGIFGAPRGAYYCDGVPKGCIDFINIDEDLRLDVQLAALKQADLAVGSVSGSLLAVLMAKCPVAEWGFGVSKERTLRHNFLKTKLVYWPEIDPPTEKVVSLIELVLKDKDKEIIYPENLNKDSEHKKNISLNLVLREICARLFLFYILKVKKTKEGIIEL